MVSTLRFQRRFIPLILEGTKTQTRRPSWEAGPDVGDFVTLRSCSSRDRPYGMLEILDVRLQRLRDLTQEDVEREGFRSIGEFRKAWGKIYGETDERETVVVYEFRLVARNPDAPEIKDRTGRRRLDEP